MSHQVVPAPPPPTPGVIDTAYFRFFGRLGQTLMHCSCCYTKDTAGQAVNFNRGTFKSFVSPNHSNTEEPFATLGAQTVVSSVLISCPQKVMNKVKHHRRKDWLERKDGDTT